jgi:hypothetical protein
MHASCSHCHKTSAELTTALKQCGKCHRQPYCSRECQVAHWPTHKSACSTGTANAAPKADEAPKATSAFNMEAFLNAIASSQSQQPSASQSRPSNTSRSSSATFGDETTAGGSLFGKASSTPHIPKAPSTNTSSTVSVSAAKTSIRGQASITGYTMRNRLSQNSARSSPRRKAKGSCRPGGANLSARRV